MIRETLMHLHWSVLPVFSMLVFFTVFIGVIFWVNRSGSKEIYQKLNAVVLEEGGSHER